MMQDVRFASVEAFLAYLPADERAIVDRLRAVVRETVQEAEERLSYNVPYYRRHKDICFIWPGSVAWAGKTKQGVILGFTQGIRMYDPHGFLDLSGRKQVGMHVYHDVSEIDASLVADYLAEAVRVDEEGAAARAQGRKGAA